MALSALKTACDFHSFYSLEIRKSKRVNGFAFSVIDQVGEKFFC